MLFAHLLPTYNLILALSKCRDKASPSLVTHILVPTCACECSESLLSLSHLVKTMGDG